MKFIISFLIILPLIFGFSGNDGPRTTNVNYKKGIVKNLGGGDKGCGWIIEIEGKSFKPKNLSKAFHKEKLEVNVDFDYSLTLFKCSGSDHDLQEIYINWIEKATK